MRIVCISDTHGLARVTAIPPGDVLVHAGDLTMRGTEEELEAEFAWLASQPHRHKVVIAGNHDWVLDPAMPEAFHNWTLERSSPPRELAARYPSLTYLCDDAAEIEGYAFYGSPWQPNFGSWAFNFPKADDGAAARSTWSAIPDGVEVLITHGPPLGTLDRVDSGAAAGCPELARRIASLDRLRLHVFGHIHEAYGCERRTAGAGDVAFVNASLCTLRYRASNEPIAIDLPDRT